MKVKRWLIQSAWGQRSDSTDLTDTDQWLTPLELLGMVLSYTFCCDNALSWLPWQCKTWTKMNKTNAIFVTKSPSMVSPTARQAIYYCSDSTVHALIMTEYAAYSLSNCDMSSERPSGIPRRCCLDSDCCKLRVLQKRSAAWPIYFVSTLCAS